ALGLAERDRLAVADIEEATDLDLVPRRLRLRLGEADAGDLRHAVSAARDVVDVERVDVVLAGDPLDADDALMARLVGEPGRADDIADGIDPGLVGLQPLIDQDMGLLDPHLGALEAEILDIADDADGEDDALGRDLEALGA